MKKTLLVIASLFLSLESFASFRVPSVVVPQPNVKGSFYGSGHVVSYSAAELQRILPDELELAPQDITAAGRHPLLILSGTHQDVRHVVKGKALSIPMLEPVTYEELIVAIPFVQLKSKHRQTGKYNGPFYYMSALFLNDRLAVNLGYLYGFQKHMAQFDVNYYKTDIYAESQSKPVISIQVARNKEKYQDSTKVAAFKPVQKMFAMPLIGKLSIGSYVCSDFLWNGNGPIQIAPVESTLRFQTSNAVPLRSFTVESKGLGKEELGSFRIISHWQMRGPFACGNSGK